MARFSLVALLILGCATVAVRPTIQDTEIINAPFDKVWGALISTLVERALPIESIEKESGLVTTKFVMGEGELGSLAGRPFDEVVETPSGLLYIWSKSRYTVSVFAAKSGENVTRVKIITHIEAFEFNVFKDWMVCYSKGIIEKQILDSVGTKIE